LSDETRAGNTDTPKYAVWKIWEIEAKRFRRSSPLPRDGASHEGRRFTETSLLDPREAPEKFLGFQKKETGKTKIT
jgi:hypothetical protein